MTTDWTKAAWPTEHTEYAEMNWFMGEMAF